MIITLALHFSGRCEEAVALYQKAFGAQVGCMLRYADARPEDWDRPLTEEQKGYIYHAELYVGEQRLMMADELVIHPQPGSAVFAAVTFDTAEQVRAAHDLLVEGGEVLYPLRSTTYSSCTCSLIDPFGFRWTLMTEQAEGPYRPGRGAAAAVPPLPKKGFCRASSRFPSSASQYSERT